MNKRHLPDAEKDSQKTVTPEGWSAQSGICQGGDRTLEAR